MMIRRPQVLSYRSRVAFVAAAVAAAVLFPSLTFGQTAWGAPTQIIENFAVPENAPADTSGALHQPLGVTADSHGNIIVADTAAARVVVLDPTGQTLVATFTCQDPLASTNCIVYPTSVSVDTNDVIYVVDQLQHTVFVLGSVAQSVNSSLQFIDRLGSPGGYDFGGTSVGSLAELDYPWVVDVDRNPLNVAGRRTNRVYILDSGNGRIVGWDCNTTPPITSPHPCGTQAAVSLLSFIPDSSSAVPPYQYMYASQGFGLDQLTGDIGLADTFLEVVNLYKWPFNSANNPALPPADPWGYQSSLGTPFSPGVGVGGIQTPTDVKFDAQHNLFVVESDNHRIEVFKQVPPPGGTGVTTINPTPLYQALTGAPNFQFHFPETLFFDQNGPSGMRALVADQDQFPLISRVHVWSPVGMSVTGVLSTLTPTAGATFTATVTVKNTGSAAVDLSAVASALSAVSSNSAVLDIPNVAGSIVPSPAGSVLGPLAPGASQAFTVTLNPKQQGTATVSFTASAMNTFSGVSLQSSPFVSQVITVQPVQAPAMSILSVTPSPRAINKLATVSVTVVIANTGTTTLTAPSLDISTSNSYISCPSTVATPATTSVPFGSTGNTFTFAAFTCTAGSTVGTTTLTVKAHANSGSTSIASQPNSDAQVTVSADTVAPVTTLTITRDDGVTPVPTVNGFLVDFPTLTFKAADNTGGSGVKQICYTFSQPPSFFPADCHNSNSTSLNFTYATKVQLDSKYFLTYYAVDNGGLAEAQKTASFTVDTTAPTASFTQLTPTPNPNGWNNTPVTWVVSPSDNVSQVQSVTFAGQQLSLTNPKVTINAQGTGLVATVIVTDGAGHAAPVSSPPVNIDMIPPTLTPIASGALVFFPPASASLPAGLGDPAPPATPLASGLTFNTEGPYQVNGVTFTNGGYQSSSVDPAAADGLPPAAGIPTGGERHSWRICDLAGNCTTAFFQPETVNQFDPINFTDALYVRYGTSGYLPTPLTPVPRPPSPPRPGRHHWSDGHGDDHRGDDHHGDDDRPAWTGHDDHRWDDDDHDDGDDCDLRTFKVLDAGGNGIVMVEHIQQSHGTEVHVGVISYSYITGCPLNCVTTQAIVPKGTTKNFEWSVDKKTGKLQELEQSFSIGHGDGLRVWGHYDAKKNQTTIQRVGPYGFKKILPGLVLLDLATRQGKLVIEYNGIVAAIQP